ncbi:helix-turn-helix domain-containing protein [Pseudogracilibacillus auburnensis]|uniref:PucR-like helix-turn-helix protein n=1 Tax=Pseudogracilibacillus auburnensis TaxID=1494959 RepID=A0A2V3VF38_9BACI|nr:PucR family transcriptional regulator [Pseudogracilibacillus auburnensis]PXW80347.1 PucR-like helix-turn-helix protein [Pseudogracilibacillus auburnensis]
MEFSYTVVDNKLTKTVDKTILNYGISIDKLLQLESFFEVVYVPENSKKLIKRVSVIELRKFSSWIKGEELALTTVENFPTKELQLTLIKELATGGVTCLAFHPGNESNKSWKIYKETIDYAKRYELPLLQLNASCTYAEIIDLLYNIEIKEYKSQVSILSNVNQLLFQYLSQTLTLDKLLRNISEMTGLQFIILDVNLNVTSSSRIEDSYINIINSNSFKKFMNDKKTIQLLTNGNSIIVDTVIEDTNFHFFVRPIKENKYVKQVLVIIGSVDHPMIDKIIESIEKALNLKKEESLEKIMGNINKANVELFKNNNLKQAKLYYSKIGYKLEDKNAIIIMDINTEMENNSSMDLNYLDNIRFRIINQINHYFKGSIFATWYNNNFVIFLTLKSKEHFEEISYELLNMMNFTFPFLQINLGLSSSYTTELYKAYNEAISAVKSANELDKRIEYFDDLSFFQIITDFGNNYYIKHFYSNELEPLLSLEEENKKEIMATLATFLDNNLNYKETADLLFVHPNTVRYRIRKVKELYKNEHLFSDSEKRLNLSIAIKMYQYK